MDIKIQIALERGAYATPAAIEQALAALEEAGMHTIDTPYTSRIGVVSGHIDQTKVAALEALACVSAVSGREIMRAI